MNQIVDLRTAVDRPFQPTEFQERQAKLDAVIMFAKRVKDWPMLKEAVDAKIEDQEEFVRWWKDNVRSAGNPSIISDAEKIGRLRYSVERAEELTGITSLQVHRWRKSLKNIDKYREQLINTAYRRAGLSPAENHRAQGTGENDWFTPETYIEAAREVMGGIDLDPASHPIAQRTVQASTFYTIDDDGLTKPWRGRVWLNPPYSQPQITQFVDKLVDNFAAKAVDQAILLTHSYTDTGWFHTAEKLAALICFTRGRVRFVDADGEECNPTQGQAFFYFGKEAPRFRDIFNNFGFVR